MPHRAADLTFIRGHTMRLLAALAVATLSFHSLPAAADQAEQIVRTAIRALVPDATIDSVRPSAVSGFHEVILSGQIIYVSSDGRFLLQGSIYDLVNRNDLTEARRAEVRRDALALVPAEKRIVYAPKERKYTLTVFTDIDCGYCRRMHQHMDEYNAAGIAIEYLFFPRAGIGSASYDKSVHSWCADDPAEALTRAKLGQELEARTCDNPVTEDFELGRRIGVTGTPAVITEDGQLIGGYLPPEQLLQRLQQTARQGGG
jgi:thiol:disulfide interchange protein DsbC